MAATLEQYINRSYKALWANSDSLNITADDVIIPKINSVIARICKGIYKNPITGQKFNAWDLPFTRKQQFYTIIDKQTATSDVAIWDTVIPFITTSFNTAGWVFTNGQVVEYTGKTWTGITWCSGIISPITAGATIYQLYAVPSNISTPFTVFLLDSNWYSTEIPYIDDRYKSNSSYYYTIVQNNSGTRYIHFFGLTAIDGQIQVKYYENSTDMVNLSDTSVIPDTRGLDMVSMLVAGEVAYENEEVDDANTKLALWCNKLDEMYTYYNSQIKRSKQQFVPQAWDYSSISWWRNSRFR
jgi:hypothetical protein